MKKIIYLLIVFVFMGSVVQGVTLHGGVLYTVSEARQIAFDGVPKKIDMSKYKEHFVDKNYEKNQELLKRGKKRYKDRYLTNFSDGDYAIRYKNSKAIDFYYDKYGRLESIDFVEGDFYPQRGIYYDKNGDFESVVIVISNKEQYIFDTNKNLIAHWIGKNCYNEKGELILTRE